MSLWIFEWKKRDGRKLAGFRPLDTEEIALVMRVERSSGQLLNMWETQVLYGVQGNFTTATILVGNRIAVGVAKRSVCDPDYRPDAMRLAFRRAVESHMNTAH